MLERYFYLKISIYLSCHEKSYNTTNKNNSVEFPFYSLHFVFFTKVSHHLLPLSTRIKRLPNLYNLNLSFMESFS